MSDRGDIRDDTPEGGTALAAEYVLGLLSREETRDFEARIAEDRLLEAEVVAWTEYFAGFADGLPEVTPPPAVKRRIEAEAFGTGRERRSVWRQILPYGLGAAVAALLVWVTLSFGLLGPGQPSPLYVADVSSEDGALAVHAGWFDEAGELLVIREAGGVPEGNSLELWVIAGDGPPVSLGLVPEDADRTRYSLPANVAQLLPGATIAISREPAGGSPTGAPTGPVVGSAPFTNYTES